MSLSTPLFEGQNICLGPIDHEKDAAVESRWSHDTEYMRLVSPVPAYPKSEWLIKKQYNEIEKEINQKDDRFYFTIRLCQDDRLIGFCEIRWIEWSNASGFVRLGIGEAKERRRGYGSEALNLILHFAFNELNLFHLSAIVPEYNLPALGLFQKAGFIEEVRRRQALNRDGRRWDSLILGMMRKEWLQLQAQPLEEGKDKKGGEHVG